VRCMPCLETLHIQLAPEPSSRIMEDESRMRKNIPADMWMEIDAGYTIVNYTLVQLTEKRLKEFRALDYAMGGLRETLDMKFNDRLEGWVTCGHGVWRRDGAAAKVTESLGDFSDTLSE